MALMFTVFNTEIVQGAMASGAFLFVAAVFWLYYTIYYKGILQKPVQTFISVIVLSVILWFLIGYSLCTSGFEGGITGNLNDFLLFRFNSQPESSIFNAAFYTGLLYTIFASLLLRLALLNRINTLSSLIFITLWLIFVAYPVIFMTLGPGLLHEYQVYDAYGGLPVHILTGFSAMAVILYARQTKITLPDDVLNFKQIIPFVAVLLLGIFFNSHSDLLVTDGLIMLVTGLIISVIVNISLKVINRKKIKPWEFGSNLMAIIAFMAVSGLQNNFIITITTGILVGLLCYYFLDYMNYEEKDPAYFILVIHGICGLAGFIIIPLLSSLIAGNQLNTINPGKYILSSLVLSAYSFLFTYLFLGFLNRIMNVREATN